MGNETRHPDGTKGREAHAPDASPSGHGGPGREPSISIAFLGPLNDLVAPEHRGVRLVVPLRRRASLKDLIESLGPPHVEVGRVEVLAVDGGEHQRSNLDSLVHPGDHITVFPVPPASAPRDPAEARFLLDVHLGKLARHLRLLGFDADYENDRDDDALARLADEGGRILLSRDRQLLKRRSVTRGCLLRSNDPSEQLAQVTERYGLVAAARPWSRCLRCNGPVVPVSKESVLELLEPKTKLYYDRFFRCSVCGRVYWEGSHCRTLHGVVESALGRSQNQGSRRSRLRP